MLGRARLWGKTILRITHNYGTRNGTRNSGVCVYNVGVAIMLMLVLVQ